MNSRSSNNRNPRSKPPTYAQELSTRIKTLEAELTQARQRKKQQQSKWEFVPASTEKGEPWLITYLDLLTLLLVLLVVMLSFAGQTDGHFSSTPTQLDSPSGPGLLPGSVKLSPDHRPLQPDPDGLPLAGGLVPGMPWALLPAPAENAIFDDLNLDALGSGIDIIIEEQTIRFRIDSEILFSSGQADLSRPGLTVLQDLLSIVKGSDYTIAVEGHTDSIPIRSVRYPSNWELSGARAGSVVRYLESNGIPGDQLRAIGYADTRPLTDNDTAQGRASNRRVELIMERPHQ